MSSPPFVLLGRVDPLSSLARRTSSLLSAKILADLSGSPLQHGHAHEHLEHAGKVRSPVPPLNLEARQADLRFFVSSSLSAICQTTAAETGTSEASLSVSEGSSAALFRKKA